MRRESHAAAAHTLAPARSRSRMIPAPAPAPPAPVPPAPTPPAPAPPAPLPPESTPPSRSSSPTSPDAHSDKISGVQSNCFMLVLEGEKAKIACVQLSLYARRGADEGDGLQESSQRPSTEPMWLMEIVSEVLAARALSPAGAPRTCAPPLRLSRVDFSG